MKTVKIQENVTRLEVTINSKTYVYKGGTTVSVPDEVAALLSANAAEAPSGVRATSEAKNAGLLPAGEEPPVPIYTDQQGNLFVQGSVKEACVVRIKQTNDSFKADKTFFEVATAAMRNMAVIGTLGGLVLPLCAATATKLSFQRSVADIEAGTLTVTHIVWDKIEQTITKTEKVYDLTEHTEETPEDAGGAE